MTLTHHDVLSIIEIVLYTPAEIVSIFLCIRHGFGINTGWIFLLLLCLIRIAGASPELATIGFPTSIPLRTSAALLSTVGLSPLLFANVGLLIRVNRSIWKNNYEQAGF
jgi:hypothetical protein